MSFQAYIDNIKTKTGLLPQDFKKLARKKGLLEPGVKAMQIVAWLKKDFGLGHGHAMAIYATFKGRKTQERLLRCARRHISSIASGSHLVQYKMDTVCNRSLRQVDELVPKLAVYVGHGPPSCFRLVPRLLALSIVLEDFGPGWRDEYCGIVTKTRRGFHDPTWNGKSAKPEISGYVW